MNYILSPCGTSLITNQANKDEHRLIFKHANKKYRKEISEDDRKKLQLLLNNVESSLKNAKNEDAVKMSAELNGIIK